MAKNIVKRHLNKIPMLAPLLGTFGVVAVLYGFEKIIDQTILARQPLFLLGIGIVILLLTGAFYEKL